MATRLPGAGGGDVAGVAAKADGASGQVQKQHRAHKLCPYCLGQGAVDILYPRMPSALDHLQAKQYQQGQLFRKQACRAVSGRAALGAAEECLQDWQTSVARPAYLKWQYSDAELLQPDRLFRPAPAPGSSFSCSGGVCCVFAGHGCSGTPAHAALPSGQGSRQGECRVHNAQIPVAGSGCMCQQPAGRSSHEACSVAALRV